MGRLTIADALFTRTQQRMLAMLFSDPERSFIQQELIDGTGAGSGAVQRELAKLVDSDLVAVSVLGRRKHYQANRHAPIFEELRSIVATTLAGVVDSRRREQKTAARPQSKWQLIFD